MTSFPPALLPRSAALGPSGRNTSTQASTAPVTHAHYRREPYVRCSMGTAVVDGKAAAWTRTQVLLHWIDGAGKAHNRWVPAATVRRIPRDESAWQDAYDDWSFYYPAGHGPARDMPARHSPDEQYSSGNRLSRAAEPVPAAA